MCECVCVSVRACVCVSVCVCVCVRACVRDYLSRSMLRELVRPRRRFESSLWLDLLSLQKLWFMDVVLIVTLPLTGKHSNGSQSCQSEIRIILVMTVNQARGFRCVCFRCVGGSVW